MGRKVRGRPEAGQRQSGGGPEAGMNEEKHRREKSNPRAEKLTDRLSVFKFQLNSGGRERGSLK